MAGHPGTCDLTALHLRRDGLGPPAAGTLPVRHCRGGQIRRVPVICGRLTLSSGCEALRSGNVPAPAGRPDLLGKSLDARVAAAKVVGGAWQR